jgi:hypothetical protein
MAATTTASTTSPPRKGFRKVHHAPARERPFDRSQSKQMAQGRDVSSVRVQQSPHTDLWHEAQGPAASAPQRTQRSTPSSRD